MNMSVISNGMKLVCITHWRLPSEKTLSPYIMRVCEAFARQGIEVELWAPRRFNPQFEGVDPFLYHLIEKNFRVKRVPVLDIMRFFPGRGGFFLMLVSFTLVLFFKIAFMRDRKQAVFYFHDIRDAWTSVFLSRKVFSEILMYYKSSVDLVNRWCFAKIGGFIFTTRSVMEQMQNDYGVDAGRMLYAPCAVNFTRFGIEEPREEARAKLGLSKDECIILYAGHLFSSKGVDTLLEAAPFLSEDGIVYFVGGTDEDIKSFKVKSEKLKVKNVVIAGRRGHEEVPLWLRAADVLVIPNTAKEDAAKYESSPSKLFEYMASGRPIVASDVPAIRDVFNESMGFFFEPDNAVSLAAAIQQVLADRQTAEEKGKRARLEARKYSWEARAVSIKRFMEQSILKASL